MVAYSKPVSCISPVAPEKLPCRVAPAELTPSVPPVTTVDVACGVGELQLVYVTATLLTYMAFVCFEPLSTLTTIAPLALPVKV